MSDEPETLSDVLAPPAPPQPSRRAPILYRLVMGAVFAGLVTGTLWWVQQASPVNMIALGVWIGLLLLWAAVAIGCEPDRRLRFSRHKPHFLLAGDMQGFMGRLRLGDKTAVLDGSNLYHFGLDEGLGTQAVRLLADQLRREGYRVVCFFDNNIFYRLIEHGILGEGQRHAVGLLQQSFGLAVDEIYVVPSGVQADKYVLSTLKHLPTSFAVTNDRFRDYGKHYASVMKGNQWRKGVYISGNEIRLRQFKFKNPLRLS